MQNAKNFKFSKILIHAIRGCNFSTGKKYYNGVQTKWVNGLANHMRNLIYIPTFSTWGSKFSILSRRGEFTFGTLLLHLAHLAPLSSLADPYFRNNLLHLNVFHGFKMLRDRSHRRITTFQTYKFSLSENWPERQYLVVVCHVDERKKSKLSRPTNSINLEADVKFRNFFKAIIISHKRGTHTVTAFPRRKN